MPNFIQTFYVNLLATTHEKLDLDIPYEVQYTPPSDHKPYTQQTKAYGLDRILNNPHTNDETTELTLLYLPGFKSRQYLTIAGILKLNPNDMGRLFLGTLLQSKLRNNKYLATINDTRGTRNAIYAAITKERLPIHPKLKRSQQNKPMYKTQFPCTRWLAAATILTTTDKKYTNNIEAKTRNKTMEEYALQLPICQRQRFYEIHA